MAINKAKLFIISAPSGAGKTSLVNAVLGRVEKTCNLQRVITYTTRIPRKGDNPGQDYYFVEKEEFEKRKEEGFFLEWSTAYGTYYGSPRSMLDQLALGISLIIILDKQGALSLREICADTVLIWITPPDLQVLQCRLQGRATETQEQVAFRLRIAEQEMIDSSIHSYFDYVIVNDMFDLALESLHKIVIQELL